MTDQYVIEECYKLAVNGWGRCNRKIRRLIETHVGGKRADVLKREALLEKGMQTKERCSV